MYVNREREKVWREAEELDFEYWSLEDVMKTITRLLSEYGGQARVEMKERSYSDSTYWALMVERYETDEEMSKRIAKEEYWANMQAERDRKEYDRLKAQFGDK